MKQSTPPEDAYEIVVTAQQWSWSFKYPNGYQSSTLHLPGDEPVKLVTQSKDVIHSVFVPAFRMKRDVVPDRYNKLWVSATTPEDAKLTSLRSPQFQWSPSAKGTNEYYLEAKGGGDPEIARPDAVLANRLPMTKTSALSGSEARSAGSLQVGDWAWADNDGLGFKTVYVRLSASQQEGKKGKPAKPDPDNEDSGYLQAEYGKKSYELICTEFCGTGHSQMRADVWVHPKGWRPGLGGAGPPWKKGKKVAAIKGCAGCHSADGSQRPGPTWKGVYGSQERVRIPSTGETTTVTVDDNYIRESILQPNAKVVIGRSSFMGPGGLSAMPKGLNVSDDQIRQLIAYIKHLSKQGEQGGSGS